MSRVTPTKAAGTVCLFLVTLLAATQPAAAQPITYLPQGDQWTPAARDAFYSTDQGSRLIPYGWARALRQPDGTPFLADSLARYGYLPNPASAPPGLPAGFTVAPDPLAPSGSPSLGMNCAACHTRQITQDGRTLRIDGGPALSDFQSFLSDLDKAVAAVLATPSAFARFATDVFGTPPSPSQTTTLRGDIEAWQTPFHTIISRSLPTASPWGVGRLDAISMIFNRVAGLDIGPAATGGMIPSNIALADAPARYPFLWNASIQDKTQWPGFAPNGSAIFALTRNTGEVLGVFAKFHPAKKPLFGIDYRSASSINLPGLAKLEELITLIRPPTFPDQRPLTGRAAFRYNRPAPKVPPRRTRSRPAKECPSCPTSRALTLRRGRQPRPGAAPGPR